MVQLYYFCPEGSCSQGSQSRPRVFRTSIALLALLAPAARRRTSKRPNQKNGATLESCALALAQVRIRDLRNWICWQLHMHLCLACSRTVCSCHATRYWSPPTKAAHTSSQPRALFPDSCHPDTFSMKINKDPKDARSRYNLQRHLPRSFFREGKVWKWEDGTVQTFKIGAGAAFQASSVQYSKLFAQRIGAASKRVLPAQTPGLWASGSGSGFGSGDRQLPSAPPSTLIHLQYLLSIAPCCNFCHLQNPNNLVLDTLAPKL